MRAKRRARGISMVDTPCGDGRSTSETAILLPNSNMSPLLSASRCAAANARLNIKGSIDNSNVAQVAEKYGTTKSETLQFYTSRRAADDERWFPVRVRVDLNA